MGDRRQRFIRDNTSRVKLSLINNSTERTFIAAGQHIIITLADFRRGEPTYMQIRLKLSSIWDSFDDAAKLAY